MKSRIEILHLTTSHRAEDNRITFGQAVSLSKYFNVAVAGLSPRNINGLNVKLLEVKQGPLIFRVLYALLLGIKLRPRVIQLHDPEMLLPLLFFRLLGIKIVFDFHEDYFQKWCPPTKKYSIKSILYKLSEKLTVPFLSLILAADSHVYSKYPEEKTVLLGNYPPSTFFESFVTKQPPVSELNVVYLGTIHEQRGLRKCVEAINLVNIPNVKLHIIGESNYPELTKLFKSTDRVTYHGRIPWEILNKELNKMHVGLAVLQPIPAYTYSPGENIVKLFEYASLGIPFIISNFDGIRKFVEKNGGGLLVDPTDPVAIAKAIELLYNDKLLYQRLSAEGRNMVLNEYNWDNQEKKLVDAYRRVLRI